MRFEILLAMISSGLYAPLLLMAVGFILAVGGAIFLWRRRTKPALSEPVGEMQAEIDFEADETSPQSEFSSAPSPSEGRRRRSLVGGAERDEGTPSGGSPAEELEAEAAVEEDIEDAEFAEYSEDAEQDAGASPEMTEDRLDENEADTDFEEKFVEEDVQEAEAELEPEWIEADTEGSEAALAAGAVAAVLATSTDETIEEETVETDPVSAEVTAALGRPVVFRQFLPQAAGKDGLSFFGGQPIGPSDFQWPRERGSGGGAPLQFVMQWDCAQLAEQDPTGLMPQDGVLYCFVNFDRSTDEDFLASHAFIHLRGSVQAWGPVAVPEDAGPALGGTSALALSGCTDEMDSGEDHIPRVLPRFPFLPIALDYPTSGDEEFVFWNNEEAHGALVDAQKSGVVVSDTTNTIGDVGENLDRPFQAFPHDFGAIRVIACQMIEALEKPDELLVEALYPTLSEQDRQEKFAGWGQEAKELYQLGTQRPSGHKLEQNIADDIWQWFDDRKGILGSALPELVAETIDLSLGVGSEALGNIPPDWIDKAMRSHALATEHDYRGGADGETGSRTQTPARMFGPASYAPGATKNFVSDHVLLLELPSGAGPQHHFGGKILQYWITPDDLASGRFDETKLSVIEPSA